MNIFDSWTVAFIGLDDVVEEIDDEQRQKQHTSIAPPVRRYELVGLRNSIGVVGTALPSSAACSLDARAIISPFHSLLFLLCAKKKFKI